MLVGAAETDWQQILETLRDTAKSVYRSIVLIFLEL